MTVTWCAVPAMSRKALCGIAGTVTNFTSALEDNDPQEQIMIEYNLDTAHSILLVHPKSALDKSDFSELGRDPWHLKSEPRVVISMGGRHQREVLR